MSFPQKLKANPEEINGYPITSLGYDSMLDSMRIDSGMTGRFGYLTATGEVTAIGIYLNSSFLYQIIGKLNLCNSVFQ